MGNLADPAAATVPQYTPPGSALEERGSRLKEPWCVRPFAESSSLSSSAKIFSKDSLWSSQERHATSQNSVIRGTAFPGQDSEIAALRPRMRGQVPSELPRAYQTRMMKSRRGEGGLPRSACGEFRGRVNTHQNQTLSFFGRPEFMLWSPSKRSLELDCRSGGSFDQPWPMEYDVSCTSSTNPSLVNGFCDQKPMGGTAMYLHQSRPHTRVPQCRGKLTDWPGHGLGALANRR